jgi:hypothetical protein
MPPPVDTAPLLPDPDRLRARLAELAREQAMLRRILRAVVRGQARALPTAADATQGPREGRSRA